MKVYALEGRRATAAAVSNFMLGDSLDENQVYYGMLTQDMKKILLAHGGTIDDNCSARPQEWKENGPGVDLWVYKSGGAVVTTYVFTNGKLTDTLKP